MSRSLWQRLRIKVTRFWWRTSRVSATRLPTRRHRPSSRSATFWRTSERRVTTAAAVHCARRHATAAGCGRRSTSCDRAAVHVSITPYVTVVFLSHNWRRVYRKIDDVFNWIALILQIDLEILFFSGMTPVDSTQDVRDVLTMVNVAVTIFAFGIGT